MVDFTATEATVTPDRSLTAASPVGFVTTVVRPDAGNGTTAVTLHACYQSSGTAFTIPALCHSTTVTRQRVDQRLSITTTALPNAEFAVAYAATLAGRRRSSGRS